MTEEELRAELRELQTVTLPMVSKQIKTLRANQQGLLQRERQLRGQLLKLTRDFIPPA